MIYYYFAAEDQIWLMTLYGKDEAADLTAKEKKALKGARSQANAKLVRR